MDAYILKIIFENQKKLKDSKKQMGIYFKDLYPIVLQDKLLKIKSGTGLYSAIDRMEKKELIDRIHIKKSPPEIIINLTKKGLDELNIFFGTKSKEQLQSQLKDQSQTSLRARELSQDRIQELTNSLELSQERVQELTRSLKLSQDQSKSLKQSLNKSQFQVKKLTKSLEILKSQKTQESHSKNKQVQKKVKEMGDAEKADLIQSVIYKIIDVMDKDYDELTQEESERVENYAEKIVDQINKKKFKL